MTSFDLTSHPHRRFNPLTGEYVLVSPHRAKRPWAGQVEPHDETPRPSYDPDCPLCPGNARAGDAVNPDYRGPMVFDNDFAALLPFVEEPPEGEGFFRAEPVSGETRVLCYSQDHGKGLGLLPEEAILTIIETWVIEIAEMSQDYPWVQVFENRGAMMGSSQPHPHGQIWASNFVPQEVATRNKQLSQWHAREGKNLLLDYVQAELKAGERIVLETDHWVALVPWWAAWPFETILLPKQHRARFEELKATEAVDLASALKQLVTRYDNLFETEFPYSMGWHFAPAGEARDPWQLHAAFYPPLLRSAAVRKFMVGYEMLAEAQRDITPEDAAERLRATSTTHYREPS